MTSRCGQPAPDPLAEWADQPTRLTIRFLTAALLLAIGGLFGGAPAGAQQALNEHCVVSVLNRTAQVRADGTWQLPNIPSGFGPVRARATCTENGVTRSGESEPFTITAGRMNAIPPIILGPTTPIPTSLAITSAQSTLTQAGQTAALTVTATFAGGQTQDVTAASTGTQYSTTNAGIVTVGTGGLVRAVKSGTVIIRATNEGTAGLIAIKVQLTGDADGDGIPDDVEIANGLNPNSAVDALEDPDHDGLSNRAEYDLGTQMRVADTDGDGVLDGEEAAPGVDGFVTSPLLADTDGDGVRDGLEISSGSDPTNPSSINLSKALLKIEVAPTTFALTVNSISGEASRQLAVTGRLKDGTSLDLTSTARGTNYTSSNLNVCNFGSPDGRVFAAADGTCTITVTNAGFTAAAQGTVQSFTPVPLSFVNIPGFANNVDVSGSFAYVAAGSTGLQVVSVSNRSAPVIVAALDTPGNANDVVVVGNLAFVADGPAGLFIVDVSTPQAPVRVGSLDTAGDAWDVVVRDNKAYVADGAAGLRIIDVSIPSAPRLLGSVDPPGTQKGVELDVVRNLAVLASGTSGIHVVDIANPAAPALIGSLSFGGDARDVALKENFAVVADLSRSMTTVDLTVPTAPVMRASTPQNTGGLLQDVVVAGNFALGADVVFVNGVPIVDVSNPATPLPRAILNFSNFRDDNGTGIAADGSFVYLTAERGISENGTTGDTRLYIGQYLSLEDRAGVAPTVSITAPADGSSVVEGSNVSVRVNAADDVAVVGVTFLVGGQPVFTDTSAPYEYVLPVPVGASGLTLGATAADLGGNVGTAVPIQIAVVPDPLTTVTGRVIDRNGAIVIGATVTVLGRQTTSGPGGLFSIAGVPTVQGPIVAFASAVIGGRTASGQSLPAPPVSSGVTNVGDIRVSDARVLLLADATSTGLTSLVQALTLAGNEVTVRQPPEYTWDNTNPPLTGFDCVIHLDGATPYNGFPPEGQTALVNYVNAGGCYVGSGWQGYEVAFGVSPLMRDLALQGAGSGIGSGAATYTKVIDHPVVEGLPATFTLQTQGDEAGQIFTYNVGPVLKVMDSSSSGESGVYVREFGAGRVVKFSFMAHWTTGSGDVLSDPNAQRLFVNAVRWASRR